VAEPLRTAPFRTALVTGAGSGIGAAVVARLLAGGTEVVALDRSFGDLPDDGAKRVTGDVTVAADRERAVAAVGDRLDLLVNAAAVRPTGPLTGTGEDDWNRCFAVNVTAAAALLAAAAPVLSDDRGSVVNVASAAAYGRRSLGAYGSSKAALISLSRTAATEFAERGIRVNVVLPGTTDTGMLVSARASGTGTGDDRSPRNLGGRVLSAAGVADTLLQVAGAALVTGAVVPVGLLPWEW